MGTDRRSRRYLTLSAVGLLLLAACGAVWWTMYTPVEPASVTWPETSPASAGFDEGALERLADDLAERNTKALLVARRGSIVFEWYAPDFGPNRRHYTAAMAKGTAAAPALVAALGRGYLSLDDHVADWVPEWRADPERARVTLRQLAFHNSGLDNVSFGAGQAGELPGWMQRYYDHPEERYRLALDSADLLFTPGTRYAYSGTGYYVLSYVVTRALQGGPVRDIPSLLAEAIYGPLGIPADAWTIGYGRSDTIDGLPLTHFGSGGELTARAAARIGQLFLEGGCHEGNVLLDADLVDVVLGRRGVTPIHQEADSAPVPASAAGWWRSVNDAWPSAPGSAAAAVGDGHQVVWIDPDHDLVVVRMGGDLSAGNAPFHRALDQYLVAPLYAAMEEAGQSRESYAGVVGTSPKAGDPTARCAG